ncbi:MAG: GNAT family N-acetyltransferase [Dehalococcoidales bacterium]|nr:GNAT family N-acetyltransferase [Dehalococcoidales bacterium]
MAEGAHPQVEVPEEIVGPRVVIRPLRTDDALAMWEAIQESRAHLAPWLSWVEKYHSLADVREYVLRARAVWDLRDDLPAGIFERVSGRFLGGTGLHRIDWDERAFEIGYWLRRTATGHGFARETVRLLTQLAFDVLGASRVEIHVDPRNAPSRRVAEAVGYEQKESPPAGGEGDEPEAVVYALTPEAYGRLAWREVDGE